jgi:hypothetical protein
MASTRFATAILVVASILSLGLLSPPSITTATATNSLSNTSAQPPDYDGPPLDYFPCNEVHDGETMRWRGAWWKCDVVIDGNPKWQWEYWGNQDPNLA